MVGIETPSWNDLTEQIEDSVTKRDFIDRFPFVEGGWTKSDIHSIGLSYYTQLGVDLGYAASVDMHVFDREFRKITQQDTRKSTAHIHDSVWYDRDTADPICAVEFEKADSKHDVSENGVRKKAEHLTETSEIHPTVETLILNYWSKSEAELPSFVLEPFDSGHESSKNLYFDPPEADVLVYESIFAPCGREDTVELRDVSLVNRY